MRKALVLIGCSVVAMAVLVSCGSSNSGTAPVFPVSAPTLPTTGNFNTTSTLAPAPSAGATSIPVPLPPAGQYAGQVMLPVTSVPAALKLTMTYSNTVPAGLTAFSAVRQTQSPDTRTPLDALSRNVVYACLASNELVQLSAAPHYSYTLPIGFATGEVAYYGAIYQNGNWVGGYAGPATVAAGPATVNVSMTGRYGFAIPANGSVCAALYARETSAPTPTPPTSGVLKINSATLTFTTTTPQTISATETGYSGVFNATSAKPAIATAVSSGASGQIVVTPFAIGTTTITVTAGTQTATVTVVVTALTPGPAVSPTPAPGVSPSPIPTPAPSPTGVGATPIPKYSTSETFSGVSTTANAWQSGGDACLTAGSAATALTSVRACLTPSDLANSGTLQLTNNLGSQTGFVISNTAILNAGGGVSVGFDYFAFNGSPRGGDGLSVFLLDANQALPTAAGSAGAGLGYAPANGVPGVLHAYLGVGLDSYGNFSKVGSGLLTGTASEIPETVAVRGAAPNYTYLGGYTDSTSGLPARWPFDLDSTLPTRPAPLHVALIVDSRQNRVTVTISGTATKTFALNFVNAGQPAFPSKVYLGFAASTGASTDFHQIRNVTINALQ